MKVKVTQPRPHVWILQARILEWVAFPFSRGSCQPRDQIQVSHIAGGFFTSWATGEAPCGELGRSEQKRGESRQGRSFLPGLGCELRGLHPAGTFWGRDSEVNTPGTERGLSSPAPCPRRSRADRGANALALPGPSRSPTCKHRVDLHQLLRPWGQKTLRRNAEDVRGAWGVTPAQSWLWGEGQGWNVGPRGLKKGSHPSTAFQ